MHTVLLAAHVNTTRAMEMKLVPTHSLAYAAAYAAPASLLPRSFDRTHCMGRDDVRYDSTCEGHENPGTMLRLAMEVRTCICRDIFCLLAKPWSPLRAHPSQKQS